MQVATPEEVIRAVVFDLKSRGISQREAALTIGKSPAVVSNFFSSNKRFSKNMAQLFNRAFGYNIRFLLYGEGEMKTPQVVHDVVKFGGKGTAESANDDIALLAAMVGVAEELFWALGDEDAKNAWTALNNGDFEGYMKCLNNITEKSRNRVTGILARFVCKRIDPTSFLPIVEDTK